MHCKILFLVNIQVWDVDSCEVYLGKQDKHSSLLRAIHSKKCLWQFLCRILHKCKNWANCFCHTRFNKLHCTYVSFSCEGLNIIGPNIFPMETSDMEFSAVITLKTKHWYIRFNTPLPIIYEIFWTYRLNNKALKLQYRVGAKSMSPVQLCDKLKIKSCPDDSGL